MKQKPEWRMLRDSIRQYTLINKEIGRIRRTEVGTYAAKLRKKPPKEFTNLEDARAYIEGVKS